MSDAPESPHPSDDPSASSFADNPWQDTALWEQLAADPRLPAVTRTFIEAALTHFKVGDLVMAERTLYPAAPGSIAVTGSPEIGAALMVLLIQVAAPRLKQDPKARHEAFERAQSILDRLHDIRRREPLVEAARALMARFWASPPE